MPPAPPPSAKKIRAVVRIRPDPRATADGARPCVTSTSADTARFTDRGGLATDYCADLVLDGHSPQSSLFALIQPLLHDALDGVSATIFACGMTGSGKTHTMNGTPTDPGVVPNAADFLFDALPRLRASVRRAELYVSTFEIYDDKIVDLCSPAHIKRSAVGEKDAASLLLLREDAVRTALALYRDPAKWAFSIRPVDRVDQFRDLYSAACKRRSTGETKLNSASSRSHLVVQFLLLQQQYPSAPTTSSQQPPPLTRYSKITLVDLAGSENNKHTGNAGKRMTESAAINGSLFHLSRVIDALAEKQRGVENVHVPYSHSKLTAALKDALGGSAQSLMIATVSPLVRFTEETRRTLDFVVKSRTIVNAATTNDIVSTAAPPPPTVDTSAKRKRDSADHLRDDSDVLSAKRRRIGSGDLSSLALGATTNKAASSSATAVSMTAMAAAAANLAVKSVAAELSAGLDARIAQSVRAAVASSLLGGGSSSAAAPLAPTKPTSIAAAPMTPRSAAAVAGDLLANARAAVRRGELKRALGHYTMVAAQLPAGSALRAKVLTEMERCRLGMSSSDAAGTSKAAATDPGAKSGGVKGVDDALRSMVRGARGRPLGTVVRGAAPPSSTLVVSSPLARCSPLNGLVKRQPQRRRRRPEGLTVVADSLPSSESSAAGSGSDFSGGDDDDDEDPERTPTRRSQGARVSAENRPPPPPPSLLAPAPALCGTLPSGLKFPTAAAAPAASPHVVVSTPVRRARELRRMLDAHDAAGGSAPTPLASREAVFGVGSSLPGGGGPNIGATTAKRPRKRSAPKSTPVPSSQSSASSSHSPPPSSSQHAAARRSRSPTHRRSADGVAMPVRTDLVLTPDARAVARALFVASPAVIQDAFVDSRAGVGKKKAAAISAYFRARVAAARAAAATNAATDGTAGSVVRSRRTSMGDRRQASSSGEFISNQEPLGKEEDEGDRGFCGSQLVEVPLIADRSAGMILDHLRRNKARVREVLARRKGVH